MFNEFLEIAILVFRSFVRIWPYLVITIPLAVAVQMSGAARHIRRAFSVRPIPSIILATLVGAFSPFCSCGVIPVVASLLIGGVPLAPVMSFWVASPSMDPEIFFLSVATLGWELALWRLLATLALSLSAGFITHAAIQRGWVVGPILRTRFASSDRSVSMLARETLRSAREIVVRTFAPSSKAELCCAVASASGGTVANSLTGLEPATTGGGCSGSCDDVRPPSDAAATPAQDSPTFWRRLLTESKAASLMVARFMLLAVFLETLFTRYVPQEWVTAMLGNANHFAVLAAALVGVPLYTSNLTALPMVGALLAQGMDPSAALAFLVAGPTTTIPAMAAVWGLVRRRVFALYLGFALLGAVFIGVIHQVIAAL